MNIHASQVLAPDRHFPDVVRATQADASVVQRVLVDLRADPFERAMEESIGYGRWATGSFSVDGIMKNLEAARAGGK